MRPENSGRPNSDHPSSDAGNRFDGRAVVVTGVSRSGQAGEVVARVFAECGAIVHCVARDHDVEDRVRELEARGLRAVAHMVDLSDFAATRALAERIGAAHGGEVAAVAALAGGFGASGPIAETDPSVLPTQLAINLTTAYSTARAFLPLVRRARGAMVFVSAAAALDGGTVAQISAYATAKGGVIQLVRALAQEERDTGVRVNAVAPTAIRTAANEKSLDDGVRYVEREEFAAAIVALCGPALARVTGQVFRLA
jgi:3-oxoacyl-[acyl-carrier protein] reductase